jgi:Transposase
VALFLGNDWAEAHHDIELVDESGRRLARRRLPQGVDGLAALHALIADHLAEDAETAEVVVGIETDRGPWVAALIAAGYTVSAVNPLQAARYRERHGSAGGTSDHSGTPHRRFDEPRCPRSGTVASASTARAADRGRRPGAAPPPLGRGRSPRGRHGGWSEDYVFCDRSPAGVSWAAARFRAPARSDRRSGCLTDCM